MTYAADPCEFCLADAGVPCAEDCVGYQPDEADAWADQFGDELHPMENSLAILAEYVHRLPFGGLVGPRGMGAPDRQDYSPEEYLSRLADWMAEYQPMLRREVDALSAQAKQAISLQFEKDVVQSYFGKVTQ